MVVGLALGAQVWVPGRSSVVAPVSQPDILSEEVSLVVTVLVESATQQQVPDAVASPRMSVASSSSSSSVVQEALPVPPSAIEADPLPQMLHFHCDQAKVLAWCLSNLQWACKWSLSFCRTHIRTTGWGHY